MRDGSRREDADWVDARREIVESGREESMHARREEGREETS